MQEIVACRRALLLSSRDPAQGGGDPCQMRLMVSDLVSTEGPSLACLVGVAERCAPCSALSIDDGEGASMARPGTAGCFVRHHAAGRTPTGSGAFC